MNDPISILEQKQQGEKVKALISPSDLGKRLKLIRNLKRLSVADVRYSIKEISIPLGLLERVEEGDLEGFDIFMFYHVCKLYQVEMDTVLSEL